MTGDDASAWFGPDGDGLALLRFFALASVRPLAMVALLPTMGGLVLPWRARLALVASLAGFAAFAPDARQLAPADLPGELIAGIVSGVAIALAFGAAQIAGEVAATMLGLGFAVLPGAGGSASVLGGFTMMLMWAAFLGADGPLLLLGGLAVAMREAPDGLEPALIAAQGLVLFAGALRLALPVAGLLLLGQVLVAIAGRSAPQLSVMAVGPATLLLAFASALPLLLAALAARSTTTLAAALALF